MPFRRRRTTVSRDEAVVFYPSFGYRDGNGAWTLVVQGCVYHPRITWLRRKPVLAVIRRAMRVDQVGIAHFQQRMRQFLVHFAPGRYISVRAGDQEASLGPSEAVGLFRGELTVPVTELQIDPEPSTPGATWVRYHAVLGTDDEREFIGRVQLLDETGVSIISDVDDTLKHSNVPNRRDLFHNTFAREFTPVPGMPELYRECSARGAAFHYVSGSPWQLFEPLAEFWNSQAYPLGSFHLKRFRLRETARKLRTMSPQKAHKLAAIEPILIAYPRRSFVLIGDSGEQDPEIYARILSERPQQIRHVYIRGVRGPAVDRPRIAATFASCPRDRWTLYQSPGEIAEPLVKMVES
jgi:phosphoserine phosphatase